MNEIRKYFRYTFFVPEAGYTGGYLDHLDTRRRLITLQKAVKKFLILLAC